MGSDPVTVVANSAHLHDQSTDLGICDSDTAFRPDWNEAALRHAGNASVVVFAEEHSLRVLAVLLAKRWRKYHLSDVAGKCTDQSAGHQWHHNIRLRKSDVGSCFWWLLLDPINGSFLVESIWIINSQIEGLFVAVHRIGHHGHRIWNPLDYHVCGYMKAMVYAHKVNTIEELLQRILSVVRSINNAAVLRKITSSLVIQVRKCIQADGGHFEKFAWVLNGESVTVHLTTYLNKCTMLLFPF